MSRIHLWFLNVSIFSSLKRFQDRETLAICLAFGYNTSGMTHLDV